MGLKGSYSFTGVRLPFGLALRRAPMPGMLHTHSKRPVYEDMDDFDEGWREASRLNEPEKNPAPTLRTLARTWQMNMKAGVVLAARRKPWKERVASWLARRNGKLEGAKAAKARRALGPGAY